MKKTTKIKIQLLAMTVIAGGLLGFNSMVGAASPPQVAIDACFDKGEGDLCEFNNDHGDSVNGACRGVGKGDGKLYCQPTN